MNGRFVDLSLPIRHGMPTYPASWHPAVQVTRLGRCAVEGRDTRKLVFGTHTGTHIDAPLHFLPRGRAIDAIPLEACIGPARLISFARPRCREVGVADLAAKLRGVRRVERLLVRFDWSKQWGRARYYREHPYFSEAACQWLIENGLRLLGIDTPSPDDPRNNRSALRDSPNHKRLLRHQVVLLEYLNRLEALKGPRVYLIAPPLRIAGADGAPTRAVACDLHGSRSALR